MWHEDRFGGLAGGVVPPVGLEEDGVDLLEIDGLGLVAHGFDVRTDAELSNGPKRAFHAACDKIDGLVGEGGVGQAHAV